MRKLFLLQFLFLGMFGVFFISQSRPAFALSACSGSCTAPGLTSCPAGTHSVPETTCANLCCALGSTPSDPSTASTTTTPLTCPTGFEPKSGVCFPKADTLGLSGMSVLVLITRVMNWLLGILGVLAVIAFVISGTQYLVSAGDEKMAETAKRNMTYAIVGLVIALAGLIIVNAIAGLTGAGGSSVVY